jgi:hypothetical protein
MSYHIQGLSDKSYVTHNKRILRLTEIRKSRIREEVRKRAEQVGIKKQDTPALVFTRKEVLALPTDLTAGRRTVTGKYLGICFNEAKTILINVKKHTSFQEIRHTAVHELVHYRFRYLNHGKDFEHRIELILQGKKYPVKDLYLKPTSQIYLRCNNDKQHQDRISSLCKKIRNYSLGDEISSSNYMPSYCNKCDADNAEECICSSNTITHSLQNGVCCRVCGHNHSFKQDLDSFKTSTDLIEELCRSTNEKYNNYLIASTTKPSINLTQDNTTIF